MKGEGAIKGRVKRGIYPGLNGNSIDGGTKNSLRSVVKKLGCYEFKLFIYNLFLSELLDELF